MSELLAGWSRQEITPPLDLPMGGYIARRGVSSGVLDPLFVRALVLRQGKLTAVVMVADLLMVSNHWAERIRNSLAKIVRTKKEKVIVAATHTHAGPMTDARPYDWLCAELGTRPHYARRVEAMIKRAAEEAAATVQPAEVKQARVLIRDVASDRNRPDCGRSQPLFLLRFDRAEDSALLGVFGCHSTVLSSANKCISGDLHGAISREFEERVSVALIANSAAANISTRFTRRRQTPAEVARLAALLIRQASRVRFHRVRHPRLSFHQRRLRLLIRDLTRVEIRPPTKAGRLAVVAREAEQNLDGMRRSRVFQQHSVTTPVTALQIDNVSLAALPFEIYSDTGDFLWKTARVIPVCYANGYWGYVPSPAASDDDYEAVSSPFDRRADARLRDAVARMVASRHCEGRR